MVIIPKYPTSSPSLILITRVSSHSLFTACENNHDPEEDEKEGNAKDFRELFTPEAKKIVTFVVGNADLMKSVSKDLKSYKIQKSEAKNEIATVTVDAVYKGNPKKVIVIELEKTDDGWKISKS
ncbi:lumazine-binding protein [Bacillus cereus]|uniref:Lumazine-binding protein n=1 Tax=Bacillus cereus TaxID=1396 RepID=A0A2B0MAP1_BACCE|nr:lumazine-binding protein [Bacillus cereus]PEQ48353.1 lumazine-binding protein [Bacillus cereus]PEX39017.1 lumazine-binding protein [Bacillus cereus]PFB14188.1 lumazine-binding protein [Bacillus cereus]PFC77311.1 lumazine-binding protein [Bacillus cereus]